MRRGRRRRPAERSADADAMWEELRIQPVEIAVPKGVGYTLRAYRLNTELTPTEVESEEDAFAIRTKALGTSPKKPVEISDEEIFSEEYAEIAERERPRSLGKPKADDSDDDPDAVADESDEVSDDIDADLEESAQDADDEEAEADRGRR